MAKSTGRSRSFLAADAINAALDINEWQVAGIKTAMPAIDPRGGAEHYSVKAWVDSCYSANETEKDIPRVNEHRLVV